MYGLVIPNLTQISSLGIPEILSKICMAFKRMPLSGIAHC